MHIPDISNPNVLNKTGTRLGHNGRLIDLSITVVNIVIWKHYHRNEELKKAQCVQSLVEMDATLSDINDVNLYCVYCEFKMAINSALNIVSQRPLLASELDAIHSCQRRLLSMIYRSQRYVYRKYATLAISTVLYSSTLAPIMVNFISPESDNSQLALAVVLLPLAFLVVLFVQMVVYWVEGRR